MHLYFESCTIWILDTTDLSLPISCVAILVFEAKLWPFSYLKLSIIPANKALINKCVFFGQIKPYNDERSDENFEKDL